MFVRPIDVPFPIVWHTFRAKDLDGTMIDYEIKDLPAEQFDEAVKLMKLSYLPDEPLAKTMNLLSEPGSVEDYIEAWKTSIDQKIAVGCYKVGSSELVAVNFLAVITEDDPKTEKQYRGNASRISFKLYGWLLEQFNVFKELNITSCLVAYGMGVAREYRYRGIATEFLKARPPMMKAINVPYTVTPFTANGTQKAAEKAGYHLYYEITYAELIKLGYPLQGIEPKSLKMMGCGLHN